MSFSCTLLRVFFHVTFFNLMTERHKSKNVMVVNIGSGKNDFRDFTIINLKHKSATNVFPLLILCYQFLK